MDRKYTYQVKTAVGEFRDFVAGHKKTGLLTALIILATWSVLGFRSDIGVDTEIMIAFPETMLKSWCGIGRFGLVFTKRLFGMSLFCQPVSAIAMMAVLWMICMTVGFAVCQWSGYDDRYRFFYAVFSAVYVTSPCLAEQFYFQLQYFEVIWGIFMAVVAVYGISRYVYGKESIGWVFMAVLCGVWAFGSYQVTVVIFIALCAFSFLLVYQRGLPEKNGERKWKWFRRAFSFVVIFMVIIMVYHGTACAVRIVTETNSAYIDGMVFWKKDGIRNCLYRILTDVKNIYYGQKPPFFPIAVVPVFLMFIVLFLKRGLESGEKEKLLYVMAGGIFTASPLFMTVLTGFYQVVRVQMVYPFILAISCAALTTVCTPEKKPLLRARAALGLSIIIAWNQWITSERLLDTMHQVSVQDRKQCEDIYREAQRLAGAQGRDISQTALVFVGIRGINWSQSTLRGDMIGYSLFQWDSLGAHGVSDRVGTLMYAMGLPHAPVTTEQYIRAVEMAESMPVWPLEGSILPEGDMVVIKLSDPVLP